MHGAVQLRRPSDQRVEVVASRHSRQIQWLVNVCFGHPDLPYCPTNLTYGKVMGNRQGKSRVQSLARCG